MPALRKTPKRMNTISIHPNILLFGAKLFAGASLRMLLANVNTQSVRAGKLWPHTLQQQVSLATWVTSVRPHFVVAWETEEP